MGERLDDSMKSILEDIKNQEYKQAYLFFGEEGYLKKQYRDKLIQAWNPEGDTMNASRFEGKGIDVKEVISLGETMPFFADRRIILLENTGFFKSSGADLADYVKEMPQTTYFIFVEEEVDKRSKLYKAVKAKGHIVELPFQDETTLKRWILGNVKREGKQMSEASAGYFLGKVGTDMQNIQGELEKLFCYMLHRDVITPEDIDAVCINQIGNHIFEMVNAVAEKKQRRALDLYYELLALKEPPMRILFLLVRQYRILFHVKSLQAKGYGRKEIAAKAGLHPFAAGKYMEQTRYFKMEELRAVLEESAELEERVKTGRLTDTLAVELFLVKYSS